jgi:hypothetical protein
MTLTGRISDIAARIQFAFRVLIGRYPLPTPTQELNMDAIDNLKAAAADVAAYVTSLQGDLANADKTADIDAVTASLRSILPQSTAPVAEPQSETTAQAGDATAPVVSA